MPSDDRIEINLSRVIPAEKEKVLRLLTKIWEFPEYIPCVKEVSVIQRKHNVLKTKWRIQVDGIPISWVEEDTIAFDQNVIYFSATEGDLEEFGGKWVLLDHKEGTEVVVSAHLKVGIPAIKDFADTYIKKLVTKNFEAILESLERRTISLKYSGYKHGENEKLAGFGIIWHLYNFNHLETCLKLLKPNFKMPSREFLSQLFHLTPSFKLYDILNYKSKTSQTVNGSFIMATFIPDMIEKDIYAIFSKVVKACKIAEKAGVGIVTLGGFASIVQEQIGQDISKQVDVPITSGNTFTVAMVVDGILKAAELLNLDIGNAKITIVGGTGDIGSGCARVFTEKAKELIITGRSKANLKRLECELEKKRKAKITTTTDNESAAKDADIVIAAASATSAILNIDWFKPGSIICDVGYPKNVSYVPAIREDILIFSGGLAKSPTPISFPLDIGLPNPDTIYGCFAEGIILALEKHYENFSFGRENITPEKIDEIRNLGKIHGFEVSDFYWGNKLIDKSIIEKIRSQ